MSRRSHRAHIGIAVVALVAASCASDDDAPADGSAGNSTAVSSPGTSSPATTAGVTTVAGASASTDPESAASAAEALEPIVVRQACAPAATSVPSALGEVNGLADEFAISFECVQVAAGPDTITALVGGEIDLAGFTAANVFAVLDQGLDLAIFRQATNADFFDIIVSSDFDLPNADGGWEAVMGDLATARIGVVARGAAGEVLARGLYSQAGLDPDGATYIATGLPNTTLAALSNGEIDAALTFEPGVSLALSQGIAVQPFSIQDGTGPELFNWPGLFIGTLRESVSTNPDLYQRFMDYSTAANEYATDPANVDEVNEFATEFLGLPPEVAITTMERTLSQINVDGVIDPAGLDAQGMFYAEAGSTQKAWTAAEITTDVE